MPLEMLQSSNNSEKLDGFEEIMAACDLLRDKSYSNPDSLLGVDHSNKLIYSDYRESFSARFTDFSSMVSEKFNILSSPSFGYRKEIEKGQLSFNIKNYSQALDKMLIRYNEETISSIIDEKLNTFSKGTSFNPTSIEGHPMGGGTKRVNNLQELKQFYKKQMGENVVVMRDIAKSVSIISQFNDMSPEFMNGGWLEAFAKSNTKDPVAYAAHHNIKIEGKDAIQWAYDNNYKVKISTAEQQEPGGKWPEKSLEPLEYMKRKGLELSDAAKESAKKHIYTIKIPQKI